MAVGGRARFKRARALSFSMLAGSFFAIFLCVARGESEVQGSCVLEQTWTRPLDSLCGD